MCRIATELVTYGKEGDTQVGRPHREKAGRYLDFLLALPECSLEMRWEVMYLQAVRAINLARNRWNPCRKRTCSLGGGDGIGRIGD